MEPESLGHAWWRCPAWDAHRHWHVLPPTSEIASWVACICECGNFLLSADERSVEASLTAGSSMQLKERTRDRRRLAREVHEMMLRIFDACERAEAALGFETPWVEDELFESLNAFGEGIT